MKDFINKYLKIFNIEIHGRGYIQKLRRSIISEKEWIVQQELFKNKVPVIFDVGSNIGRATSKYLTIFPNSKIHSFEPFPDSYKEFLVRHKNSMGVKLNKYALSSEIGSSILNINKSVDTNSLLKSKKIGANSDKSCISINSMTVKTNTLDNYCIKNNIREIDILKIDVQGSEIKVLKGALNLLEKNRIKLIYIETYFKQQYVDQPLFHDISKFLYNYNFILQDIYDPYFSRNNMMWSDAIFINLNYFN